jgi:hypothetical protein
MTRFVATIIAVAAAFATANADSNILGQIAASAANEHVWMPRQGLTYARSDVMTVAVNGLVYAIGGCQLNGLIDSPHFPGKEHHCTNISTTVEVFDPKTNTYTDFAELPAPRFRGVAVAHGSHLYVFAGIKVIPHTQNYADYPNNIVYPTFHDDVLVLDTEATTPAWSVADDLPLEDWSDMTGFEYNHKIYIVGGYANGADSNMTAVYNPISGSWEEENTDLQLNVARGDTSAAVMGNKAYVFGGFTTTNDKPTPLNTLEVLDFDNFEAGWVVHHERAG